MENLTTPTDKRRPAAFCRTINHREHLSSPLCFPCLSFPSVRHLAARLKRDSDWLVLYRVTIGFQPNRVSVERRENIVALSARRRRTK